MRFTQCFKILLEIPSYPEAFFLSRYVTVFIISISVTRSGFISLISLVLYQSFLTVVRLYVKLMYLLFKFSVISIKNLLKILATSVASVIRPASEFILVPASYNWDLAVESFIIFHAVFHFVSRSFNVIIKMCCFCFCNYFLQDSTVFLY